MSFLKRKEIKQRQSLKEEPPSGCLISHQNSSAVFLNDGFWTGLWANIKFRFTRFFENKATSQVCLDYFESLHLESKQTNLIEVTFSIILK